MARSYRLGVIGFAHMHVNNLAGLFAKHPQVEWVACADTIPANPELRKAPHTREWNRDKVVGLGVPKTYDDYRKMLEQEKFDIMIVCSENARHAEVVEACAAAGVHVVTEKPMAASLADGLRMVRASEAAGAKLIVNWPTTWQPAVRKAKELLDDGIIGRILEVKWRAGHTGPLGPQAKHPGTDATADIMTGPERAATWWHQDAPGGGAMVDYCCYGAKISRWFVGEPATSALGLRANLDSHWGDAEDNAVILVRFPSALALLEGSWTTIDHGVSPGPIVYGVTGTLVVESKQNPPVVRIERGHGDTQIITPDPLPQGRHDIAHEVIHHLETGDPLHPTLEVAFNVEAQAILDAGLRSAASQKMELINNATWQIG
ncbi:MAG: Gfo/Idh/MocA family oxidoreductase [Caldilineaceae bacterium]|nr:Gfo/Idh/MocA family oxidoreductase [Caldilineaceae bacterium]